MAKKKAPTPKPEKPKLANTKPKIVKGKNVDPVQPNQVAVEEMWGIPELECLSENHRQFVIVYCNNGHNATKAYLRANFGPSTYGAAAVSSCHLLKNPKIKAAVDAVGKLLAGKPLQDNAQVVHDSQEVFDKCMEDTPVLDMEGNHTGFYKINAAGAIAAKRLIADVCGLTNHKTQVEHSGNINHAVSGAVQFTLDELRKLPIDMRESLLDILKERKATEPSTNGKQ